MVYACYHLYIITIKSYTYKLDVLLSSYSSTVLFYYQGGFFYFDYH